jgi:DNA-binding NarL/FixJ family response regulator
MCDSLTRDERALLHTRRGMMWNDKMDFLRFSREGNVATSEMDQAPIPPISVKRRPEELTPREHEILQLVWAGLTNRIIAEQLHISVKTAEAHRANMMKKLRVSNIAQLLKTALEEGLLATQRG